MIACQYNKAEIAFLLIDEADITNNNGWNGLMVASSNGLMKVVESILSNPELKE